MPYSYIDDNAGSLVLLWRLDDNAAKAAVRENPALQERERQLRDKQGAYYLELLDMANGKVRARVIVETGKGSFGAADVFFTNDRLFMQDNHERVLAFSLDGKLQGRVFGRGGTTSPDGKYLLVYNSRGRLTILDSKTLEQREQLDFAEPISLLRFGAEPSLLRIITADQTLYDIDLKRFDGPPQAGQ
jgi:hypothetical protein